MREISGAAEGQIAAASAWEEIGYFGVRFRDVNHDNDAIRDIALLEPRIKIRGFLAGDISVKYPG